MDPASHAVGNGELRRAVMGVHPSEPFAAHASEPQNSSYLNWTQPAVPWVPEILEQVANIARAGHATLHACAALRRATLQDLELCRLAARRR